MKSWRRAVLLSSLLLGCAAAQADEAKVKRDLQTRLKGMRVDSVTKSPFAGLYEVVVDGEVLYTDEKAEYFFSGDVYDIRRMPPRNLTEGNARRSTLGVLAKAAEEVAIKSVRGTGKRVLYTFEDPNCSYCKALRAELARMRDVTIYTFPTPILSLDSAQKSLAAWCSPNRSAAWETLMSGGTLPADAGACANPLEKVAALAKRLEVTSTPVMFLGNGQRINGFTTVDQIEQALAGSN
jgi:thiol:disulfide interchange protein DsbC